MGIATVHYLSMNTGSGQVFETLPEETPEYGGVSYNYSGASLAPTTNHTIVWGDGTANSTPTTDGSGNFTVAHIYALVGQYTMVVTETTGGRVVARETVNAEVKPGTMTIPGTVTNNISASFSGSGYNPSTAYSIAWGDGTANATGTTTAPGAIGATSHTYTTTGSKTLTVTVAGAIASSNTFTVV